MVGTRENLWLPLVLVAAAVVVFGVMVSGAQDVAARRTVDEDAAMAVLKRVADAQRRFHERRGRYGWLGELRSEGLLDGLALREDDPGLAVAAPGYRVDVLLPKSLGTGEQLFVVPRWAGDSHPQLSRSHYVAVARPWTEDVGGWRSYATDETGRYYVNEGVSDLRARRRPGLPDLHLSRGHPAEAGGMRWWPLDDLPPR